MPETKESRFAKALAKHLDTMELENSWVVFSLSDKGTAIQRRMFDLCLAFLRNWSGRYRNKDIKPNQILYPICELSDVMIRALDRHTDEVPEAQPKLPAIQLSPTDRAWRQIQSR